MVQTDFSTMQCTVARSMDVVGERWAILVLREAFYGTTRFDDFQRNLGVASNILSARLAKLVEHGVLEKVPCGTSGTRHAYELTEKGRDFFSVYVALKRWGDRWVGDPKGPMIKLLDRHTGDEIVSPPLTNYEGKALGPEDIRIVPGPAATPRIRARFAPEHQDV